MVRQSVKTRADAAREELHRATQITLIDACKAWADAHDLHFPDPNLSISNMLAYFRGEAVLIHDIPDCPRVDYEAERTVRIIEKLAQHGHSVDVLALSELCSQARQPFAALALGLKVESADGAPFETEYDDVPF